MGVAATLPELSEWTFRPAIGPKIINHDYEIRGKGNLTVFSFSSAIKNRQF